MNAFSDVVGSEIHGTIPLGQLKRIVQVVYLEKHPEKAPFSLNGKDELDYIRRGKGQPIPVRLRIDENVGLEKVLKLKFMKNVSVWSIPQLDLFFKF
jgi:hypothetical protein